MKALRNLLAIANSLLPLSERLRAESAPVHIADMKQPHAHTYIGQLELLAAVVPYVSLAERLRGRRVIHWMDNTRSIAALIRRETACARRSIASSSQGFPWRAWRGLSLPRLCSFRRWPP
jgi:hypothetical protein